MRMDYETFKEKFIEQFRDFLPEEYREWTGVTGNVPKVNGYMEAYHLIPEKKDCAAPTLYFRDLYGDYLRCGELDKVCKHAADFFTHGMEYVKKAAPYTMLHHPMEKVIFQLVSTEKNKELLQHVPHRAVEDLTLIYRLLVNCPGGGFNSAIVTHELAEDIHAINEQQLYDAALENTPKLFPCSVMDIGCGIRVLSNVYQTLGATAVLYPKVLEEIAEDVNSNLLIIPSSIHEFFILPDIFEQPEELKEVVEHACKAFYRKEDLLSESIYFYDKRKKELKML